MVEHTLTNQRRQIKRLLTDAIASSLKPKTHFGVLFSGGLDSCIIAASLTSIRSEPFPLLVTGTTTAQDIAQARMAAAQLELPLSIRTFTKDEVRDKLPHIIALCKVFDILHVELGISFFFAAECAHRLDLSVVFTGQGADELFGGYARHERLFLISGSEKASAEMRADLRRLQEETLPCLQDIVKHFGLHLVSPFLNQALVEYSHTLPFSCKIVQHSDGVIRKQLLRNLAQDLELPSRVVNAPKRALQYGSGAHRMITELAADYWAEKAPQLSIRKAKTHTRVMQYLTQVKQNIH